MNVFQIDALSLSYVALLLLPGAAVACCLRRRIELDELTTLIVLTGTCLLLGYASFWLFFWNKTAGRLSTYGFYIGSIALLVWFGRDRRFWMLLARHAARPFALAGTAVLLYLSLLWLYGDPGQGVALPNFRFFDTERPGDNLIPLIFADKIYGRLPMHPFCCGDWLSSDRPPLQSGLYLMLMPLRLVRAPALLYQIIATILQCFFIPAAWGLGRACGLSKSRTTQALTLIIFSAFFFYNGVFVWPKLLASACIVFAIAVIVRAVGTEQPVAITESVLGGLAISLGLLAHPGSVFSLPAFAMLAVSRRWLFPLRPIVAAIVLCVLLLASWSAYQRWIDPPGNRLTKMHLAGVLDIDSRSLPQTLYDAYHQRSIREIVNYKTANLATLIGTDPLLQSAFGNSESARIAQREFIWSALGFLEAGWIALLLWIAKGRTRLPELKPFAWLAVAAVFNLLIWCAALFGPGGAFTTHSSYADMLLLALSLSMFVLVALPRWCAALLAGCEVYHLFAAWALPRSHYIASAHLALSFLAESICITAALLYFGLLRPARKSLALSTTPQREPAPE